MPQKFQERFGWAASLLTGGFFQLCSAAFQAQSQGFDHPDKATAAAFSVIAGGVATVLINHFGSALKEAQTEAHAERNHLVRRGMGEALQSALRRAQADMKPSLPSDQLFASWFQLLDRALKPGSSDLESLFPLDISEDHWNALTRYEAHFDPDWLARQPEEMRLRILARSAEDRDALFRLLRSYLTQDDNGEMVSPFNERLLKSWDEHEAKDFASRLLPFYRTAFAAVFSRGGVQSEAIGYKGMTLTLEKLDAIQTGVDTIRIQLSHGFEGVIAEVRASRGTQKTPPEFSFSLESMEPPVGREREIVHARDLWLTNRQSPLLIWGPPGIGKSTLARSILRDPKVEDKFGNRRYELQCDYLTGAEDFIRRVARDWFGLTETNLEPLQDLVLRRLSEKPCAILVDNFETLMESRDPKERDASQRWLSKMAAKDGVWTIAGVMGHKLPGGISWARPISPEKVGIGDAREIFCAASLDPAHANDPRANDLIESVERVPHFVKLLGGAARGFPDLESLWTLWSEKRTAMLPGGDGHTRPESAVVAYDFAIQCLDSETLMALKVLAWLPAGLAGTDLDAVLDDGLQADLRLYSAALAYREGSPYRLRMLKPLKDYVERKYPASDAETKRAVEHFLALASSGNELGGSSDGDITPTLATEYLNAIQAINATLNAGNSAAVQAAYGLLRFCVRTHIVPERILEVIGRSLDLSREKGQKMDEAWCLTGLGVIGFALGALEKSTGYYNEARSIFIEAFDKRGEASCLRFLGDIAHFQHRSDKAAALYNEAQLLFRDAGEHLSAAWCIWGVGDIAYMQDENEKASGLFHEARTLFRDTGDKRGEAWCLRGLGDIAHEHDENEAASGFYHEARTLFRDAHDKRGEATCLQSLGDNARRLNENEKAARFYDDARPFYRDAGDKRGEAECLCALGKIAYIRNETQTAARLYTEARPLFKDAGGKQGEARCLRGLGDIARLQDEDENAAGLYHEARSRYRDAGDKEGEAWCLESLGDLLRRGDARQEARAVWTEALTLFQTAGAQPSADRVREKLNWF